MPKFFITATESDFSTRKATVVAPTRRDALIKFNTTGTIDRCVDTSKKVLAKYKDGKGGTLELVDRSEVIADTQREADMIKDMEDTGRIC